MMSRKWLTPIMLIIISSAAAGRPARAQAIGQKAFYNKPRELKLERTAKRLFRSYRGGNFAVESFYPIGWSKQGNFAYYVEPVDEACNCYFAKLFIVDLKTDKVLWSFDYDSGFIEEAQGKPYTFDALWDANRKQFSEKLREHGIEPQRGFTLLSFPARHKSDLLAANLKTIEKAGLSEEQRLFGIVGRATLQLISRRKGNKTILDQSYQEVQPLYVGLVGHIKSPFQPRIATVLIEIIRGWEGPPHTGHVRITGASLDAGFK